MLEKENTTSTKEGSLYRGHGITLQLLNLGEDILIIVLSKLSLVDNLACYKATAGLCKIIQNRETLLIRLYAACYN